MDALLNQPYTFDALQIFTDALSFNIASGKTLIDYSLLKPDGTLITLTPTIVNGQITLPATQINQLGSYQFLAIVNDKPSNPSLLIPSRYAVNFDVTTPITSVSIAGTPDLNQTLTSTLVPNGATVNYQWQKSANGVDWVNITTNATSATYTLTEADRHHYIRLAVEGTGTYGGSAISNVMFFGKTISQTFYKDTDMATAVAAYLSKSVDDYVTCEMIQTTKSFILISKSISDITGIGVFNQLENVTLNSNDITYIPAEIGNLSKLTIFSIQQNLLTDIPSEFYTINSLVRIIFNNNNLTSISSDIGNLTNLVDIGFRANHITAVPSSIASLTKLNTLMLSTNNIYDFPASVYTKTGVSNYEFFNQTYNTADTTADLANVDYSFDALAIFSQIPTFGDGSQIEYKLTDPNSIQTTLSLSVVGGKITIPAQYLNQAGNYSITASVINSKMTPSTYTHTFTLTGLTSLTISGIAHVDQILSKDILVPGDATVNYQWQISNNGVDFNDISLANGTSYTILEADIGKYIRLKATGAQAGVYENIVYSNVKGPIVSKAIEPIISVSISGTPDLNQILNSTVVPNGATVNYQWQKSANGVDWVDITTNAIGSTYTLTETERHHFIRLEVEGTGDYGGIEISNVMFFGKTISQTFYQDIDMANAVAAYLLKSVDDYVTYQMIQTTTSFPLSTKSISDITGIGVFNKLEVISLSYNDITYIPSEIKNITNLKYLYLDNNKLTTLPSDFSALTKLDTLWLNNNLLTSVPTAILDVTSLKILRLGFNQITIIPEGIGNLTNLTYFGFRNNLVEVVPSSIANLTNLNTLLMSGNKIHDFDYNVYNKSIGLREYNNQVYIQQLSNGGANKDYTFDALQIYTDIISYSGSPSITYTLVKPDLSEVVLSNVEIVNGKITIPASMVSVKGDYIFRATIDSGYLNPSIYTQNFTLTGIDSVSIKGTAQVGQTLEEDVLVPNGATVDYQWQISANGIDGWTDISGATNRTHVIASGSEDQYIRLMVIGKNEYSGIAYSAPTSKILRIPIESVTIKGTAQIGEELSVDTITPNGATINYQWQSSLDGLTWADIPFANAATYTVESTDFDKYMRLKVEGYLAYEGIKESAATASKVVKISLETITITKSNNTLSLLSITPTGAEDNVDYQWQSSNDNGTTWTDIFSAIEKEYTFDPIADFGKSFRLQASGKNDYTKTISSNSIFYGVTFAQNFTELNMAGAVANELGKVVSDRITFKMIEETTNLDLSNKLIKDISGIKIFKNLLILDLSYNFIEVVSLEINDLTKLDELYLNNNKIIDFKAIIYNRGLNGEIGIVNFTNQTYDKQLKQAYIKNDYSITAWNIFSQVSDFEDSTKFIYTLINPDKSEEILEVNIVNNKIIIPKDKLASIGKYTLKVTVDSQLLLPDSIQSKFISFSRLYPSTYNFTFNLVDEATQEIIDQEITNIPKTSSDLLTLLVPGFIGLIALASLSGVILYKNRSKF